MKNGNGNIQVYSPCKGQNKYLILDLIRRLGPISRVQLASIVGISTAAVTGITNTLIPRGLIREIGLGESQQGRKPILLEINPEVCSILGIDVGRVSLRGCLADLTGRVLQQVEHPIHLRKDWQRLPDLTVDMINLLLADPLTNKLPVVGIGIATVGNPNVYPLPSNNARLQMYPEALSAQPLKEIVEEKTGLPVRVANATDAAALAETWCGSSGGINTLVFVTIGTGVKASLVIRGELFPDQPQYTSEFGHTTIVVEGDECWCGNRGCLELYTSRQAILNEAKKEMRSHPESLLYQFCEQNPAVLTANHVFEAARAGDPAAAEVIDTFLKYFGAGIVNLVNLYSPDLILIGTREMPIDHLEQIIPPLQKMVQARAIPGSAAKVKIGVGTYGVDAYLMGATTLVSRALFTGDEEIEFPDHGEDSK